MNDSLFWFLVKKNIALLFIASSVLTGCAAHPIQQSAPTKRQFNPERVLSFSSDSASQEINTAFIPPLPSQADNVFHAEIEPLSLENLVSGIFGRNISY